MDYNRHIGSHRWKEGVARIAEIMAAGNACRLCPAEGTPESPIEGHHRTYRNFGEERIGDVTALCRQCHQGVTSMLNARKYLASPAVARDHVSHLPAGIPLFDPFHHEVNLS